MHKALLKTRYLFSVGVALLALAPSAAAAPGNTILVKFARPATAAAKVKAEGDTLAGQTATRTAIVRMAPGETVESALAAYRARADIVYAEPNHRRTAF